MADELEIVGLILAGGRGTRMGKLTESVPKPLVPVFGKPALFHVLDGMVEAGIKRFVVVTGYLDQLVRVAVAEEYGEQSVTFVHQAEQRGTAHAVGLTRDAIGGSPFLLAYADIITSPENYRAMTAAYQEGECSLTAAVRWVDDPWRAAAVYFDDDHRIDKIIEKPPVGTSETHWAHAGMYCFGNETFDFVEKVTPSARGELEITDAVSAMIASGRCCKAVEFGGYWKDLATPEDIIEAEDLIRRSVLKA